MKRIFSFAIAAAMLLSITACGNGSSADGQGSTQGSGGQAQGNTPAASSTNVDGYPSSPITFYCPWAAGGSSDLMCRQISSMAGDYFDGAVTNVVNREGGNGAVALGEIASSSGKSDGYTWSFASDATLAINPYVNQLEYSVDDFTIVAAEYVGLFVRGDSEFNSLQDIVDHYTSTGETLLHGQAGAYSRNHLTSIVMFQNMGVKEELVPYSGASEAIAALLGGEVDFVLIAPGQALSYMESGDMKGIAMLSESRADAFPEIATVAEQGFGEISAVANRIVIVPSDTPDDIVAYLREGFAGLAKDPKWLDFLDTNGIMPCEWSAEDLQDHLAEETLLLWDVMEDLDLLVDGVTKPAA
jgi:tripartite-type tricarboxylate transporter receptor subunit TctC